MGIHSRHRNNWPDNDGELQLVGPPAVRVGLRVGGEVLAENAITFAADPSAENWQAVERLVTYINRIRTLA